MDPSQLTRRSPPQLVLDIIENAVKSYRSLSAKIKSKQKAINRLEQGPPRSIKTKMTLNVSSALDDAGSGMSLRDKFDQQLAANESALTAIIKETTLAELELLMHERDTLSDQAVNDLKSFYGDVHAMLSPNGPPWDSIIIAPNGQPSIALTDFLTAKARLHNDLVQLRYDLAIQQVVADREKAAKEAARATAMDLETETPMSISVQELVHQRIQQELRPLKTQVTQLKEALNGRTGHRGAATGAKTNAAQPRQQQKTRGNGTGKTAATGAAKPGKPATKPKHNGSAANKRARKPAAKTRSK